MGLHHNKGHVAMLCSSVYFNHFGLSNTISVTQHIRPFKAPSTGLDPQIHSFQDSDIQMLNYPVSQGQSSAASAPDKAEKSGEGAHLEGLVSQPRSGGTPVCITERGSGDYNPWNHGTIRTGSWSISWPVFYSPLPFVQCRPVWTDEPLCSRLWSSGPQEHWEWRSYDSAITGDYRG